MTALPWSAAWRIARRDLHRRFRGLSSCWCACSSASARWRRSASLTSAIRGELDSQGQTILGGDLEVEVWQRLLNDEERRFLASYGWLSEGYRMQAMARHGEATAPIELKAVDAIWPLYGHFTLADGREAGSPTRQRGMAGAGRGRAARRAAWATRSRSEPKSCASRDHRRRARPAERGLPARPDGDRGQGPARTRRSDRARRDVPDQDTRQA